MSIKKKLLISNLLMYIIPIIVMVAMGIVMFFVFKGITGNFEFGPSEELEHNGNFVKAAIGFAFLICIIFITSRILTKFVFHSIGTSIDTLAFGVHQISDGNLKYRIEYGGKDEFSKIVTDFNEMAQRLSDFVDERTKSEQNRKELVAGISHDLRTPLTSVKGYVKGLQDGVAKSPEKVAEYLDIIYRKTCEIEVLADQLLLFSKLDSENFPFHFAPLNVHNYVVTTLDSLEYDLKSRRAVLSFSSNCETQKVLIDGEQMSRVLSNILHNCTKHNKGKEVKIDVTLLSLRGAVVLQIQDNGQGISAEKLPHLFDVFYRGNESRSEPDGGSGLGLSIAKKIVNEHGGKITAKSGKGLIITIELPIATQWEE